MTVLLVTVDTNIIDETSLKTLGALLADVPHELGYVSVTERERGIDVSDVGTRVVESAVWGESVWDGARWFGPVPAVFVLDESPLAADTNSAEGVDVLADQDAALEHILRIIGSGSFPSPGRRDELSDGVRRQLRDGMILEAHIRAGRHLFVSNDERAFIRHGKRALLETFGRTRILTLQELTDLAARHGLDELLPAI